MNLLEQIQYFQRHGVLLGKRRPLAHDQRPARLQHIAQRQAEAARAGRHPQPGWLNLHGNSWERFFTRQRCLLLEYGFYAEGEGRLLEIRIAPDGTSLLRVTSLGRDDAFSQRIYLSPSIPRAHSTRSLAGPPGPPGFQGGVRSHSLRLRS